MAATTTAASPVAAEPGSLRSRNPQLEGLRAVAALAVLVTHVSLNAMGNRGPFGGLLGPPRRGRRRLLRAVGLPALPAVRPGAAARRAAAERPPLLPPPVPADRAPLLGRGGGVVPVRPGRRPRDAHHGLQHRGRRRDERAALDDAPVRSASPRCTGTTAWRARSRRRGRSPPRWPSTCSSRRWSGPSAAATGATGPVASAASGSRSAPWWSSPSCTAW